MRLYVTDTQSDEVSFDVVRISTNEFNQIRNHPYIASMRFDEVIVDISPSIKLGYLIPLMKHTRVIPKIGEIDSHTITILSEICRDRAAELRYSFIRDKEKCKEIVENLKEEYGWNQFY